MGSRSTEDGDPTTEMLPVTSTPSEQAADCTTDSSPPSSPPRHCRAWAPRRTRWRRRPRRCRGRAHRSRRPRRRSRCSPPRRSAARHPTGPGGAAPGPRRIRSSVAPTRPPRRPCSRRCLPSRLPHPPHPLPTPSSSGRSRASLVPTAVSGCWAPGPPLPPRRPLLVWLGHLLIVTLAAVAPYTALAVLLLLGALARTWERSHTRVARKRMRGSTGSGPAWAAGFASPFRSASICSRSRCRHCSHSSSGCSSGSPSTPPGPCSSGSRRRTAPRMRPRDVGHAADHVGRDRQQHHPQRRAPDTRFGRPGPDVWTAVVLVLLILLLGAVDFTVLAREGDGRLLPLLRRSQARTTSPSGDAEAPVGQECSIHPLPSQVPTVKLSSTCYPPQPCPGLGDSWPRPVRRSQRRSAAKRSGRPSASSARPSSRRQRTVRTVVIAVIIIVAVAIAPSPGTSCTGDAAEGPVAVPAEHERGPAVPDPRRPGGFREARGRDPRGLHVPASAASSRRSTARTSRTWSTTRRRPSTSCRGACWIRVHLR